MRHYGYSFTEENYQGRYYKSIDEGDNWDTYSFTLQNYQGRYPSAQAAADAAFGNEPDRDGVWVCEAIPPDLVDLIDIDGLLDDIQEAADDLCGEASEGWLDHLMADKEAKADLEKMVADWLRVRAPIDFCTTGDERYFKRELSAKRADL